MGSLASSDPFVLVAWATGLASLGLSGVLTLEVVRVRRRAIARARRRAEFLERWRPILYDAALGGNPPLSPVAPADEDTFLGLWNDVQEALHGDSRAALNAVAEAIGAADAARRRLADPHGASRAQALRTLGHLGRREDYPLVLGFLDDGLAYLSLIAARALVRIDPERAPADVVPRLAARDDWPVSLLLTALAGAPPGAVAGPLRAACAGAAPERLVRVVGLAELLDGSAAEDVLRGALAASGGAPDAEVLAAVLRLVRSPGLADVAREACAHPAWAVRTQAAAALGRVGEPGDRERLLPLLKDPQWWVRYRAAQALTSGRFGPPAGLAALVDALDDRYARDILAHVLAERAA